MMELGYSNGLWGLLGMMVPLIIHLLSKQRQQEISFGSVRFLEETASDRARSLHLSQYALLLLRMLIVGLLAVMISAPTWPDKTITKYIYLPEDTSVNGAYTALLQDYNQEEYTYIHYNIEGTKTCEDCKFYPSLNTLITSLNNDPDTAILMTYGYQRDVVGRLPALNAHVQVIQLPLMENGEQREIVIADSTYQIRSTLQEGNAIMELGSVRSSDGDSSTEIKVCLLTGNKSLGRGKEISELLAAMQKNIKYDISYNCNQEDWIIAIDTMVQSTGTPIIDWDTQQVNPSFRWDGGLHYEITGSLSSSALQATNLPLLLTQIITARKLDIEQYDQRVVDLSQLVSSPISIDALVKQARVGGYFVIIILILIAVERIVSYKGTVNL